MMIALFDATEQQAPTRHPRSRTGTYAGAFGTYLAKMRSSSLDSSHDANSLPRP